MASEVIWQEVFRLRESGKAVVASMGNVAASGGYYIACPADVIVALPQPDRLDRGLRLQAGGRRPAGTRRTQQRHRAAGRAGLDVLSSEGVQRGRACSVRDDNRRRLRRLRGQGRCNAIRSRRSTVARGRVWTGQDALEAGLVDELGGLRDAVRIARELAHLPENAPVRVQSRSAAGAAQPAEEQRGSEDLNCRCMARPS